MMKKRLHESVHFLRTTAIGGVLFLLPILVVLGLLGYVYHAVVVVHDYLSPWIPLDTATGFALLFGLAVVGLVVTCFIAGLAARRAVGTHFSNTIEKQLMTVIPKYGIYKDLLAGKIGGNENVPSLTPVLVKCAGVLRPAFQADRLESGLIVVYLPGAPDVWNGSIALFAPADVQAAEVTFTELLGICERLGRDSRSHLNP